MRGVRRGLVLLATGAIVAGGASGAAAQPRPGAVVQPLTPDNGAELRGYLTTLANNPQSLDALIGAGRAALRMGDAAAALTFFGRADEISPRNPRVKAGMASTLVNLGQPQAALSLFGEAVAAGAPEAEIQADRGLAFDMNGDPRRAQQDYVASLRRRDDPDLRRRLALSLAISGQRDAALRTIDAQLRANDRAGWRTQAFILALTGDAAGAERTAQAQMPPAAAQQMAPFFARLRGLSPAQKALAVHLGRFPSDGRAATQTAQVDTSPDPTALAFVGVPARSHVQPGPTTRTRGEAEERRPASSRRRERPDPSDPFGLRAGRQTQRQEAPASRRPGDRPTEVAEVNTRWSGSPYPAQAAPSEPQPAAAQPQAAQPQPQSAPVQPRPAVSPPSSTSSSAGGATAPQTETQASVIMPVTIPASTPEQVSPAAVDASSAASIASASASPAADEPEAAETEAPVAIAPAQRRLAEPATGAPSLADIAAVVNALPEEPQAQSSPASPPPPASVRPAQRTRVANARTAERPARTPAPPANPSRHWVQIAGGIDRASLPREFARLRALAPEQLGRRTAFAAPLRTTSRLLVGPFASTAEAQAFVNELARHDITAFAWTSAAGQEIERLASR